MLLRSHAPLSKEYHAILWLAFASGLPHGLLFISLSDFLRSRGVDIRFIGSLSLLQLPWILKVLLAPWLRPSIKSLVIQLGLSALFTTLLALASFAFSFGWSFILCAVCLSMLAMMIDLTSTTMTLDLVVHDDLNWVGGVRSALSRMAMGITGGLAISLTPWIRWPSYQLWMLLLIIPILFSLRHIKSYQTQMVSFETGSQAWRQPIQLFLLNSGPILLVFFFLFKFGDALAGSLIRPFLVDLGYSPFDRGFALAIAALGLGIVGTLLGARMTHTLGLRTTLIVSGFLQTISNLGYYILSDFGVHRGMMFSAIAVENFCGGIGTAALQTLILKKLDPASSTTQYALVSLICAIPGMIAGPIAGWSVHMFGWQQFFLYSLWLSLPALILVFKLDKRTF